MTQQNGPKHEYMNSGSKQLIDEVSNVLYVYNTRQSDGSVYGGSIQSQKSGVYGSSIQSQESGQYATTQRHTLSETETSSMMPASKRAFRPRAAAQGHAPTPWNSATSKSMITQTTRSSAGCLTSSSPGLQVRSFRSFQLT